MSQGFSRAVLLLTAVGLGAPVFAQDPPPGASSRVIQIPGRGADAAGKGTEVPLLESWSLVEAGVRGQWQLRNVKESEKKSNAAIDAATILVTFENRLSHEDAVNR